MNMVTTYVDIYCGNATVNVQLCSTELYTSMIMQSVHLSNLCIMYTVVTYHCLSS